MFGRLGKRFSPTDMRALAGPVSLRYTHRSPRGSAFLVWETQRTKKPPHHHRRSIYRRPIAYLLCLAAWHGRLVAPLARQCPSVPGSLPSSIWWWRLGGVRAFVVECLLTCLFLPCSFCYSSCLYFRSRTRRVELGNRVKGGWLTLNYCTAIVELEAEARISEYRCHSSASCLEFEFAIAWEGGSADQKSHQYASGTQWSKATCMYCIWNIVDAEQSHTGAWVHKKPSPPQS